MKTKVILTSLLTAIVSVFMFSTVVFAASIEIKAKEGIGNYLTDEKGMTLYLFKKDTANKSACAGSCVDKWPLFTLDAVTVPEGLHTADFGTITREDGKKQTTYKGMPLYYFFKDVKPGEVAGQGFNNVWYVVAP